MEGAGPYAMLVGRILISQIFLVSGIMKVIDWSGTQAVMAGKGMFWIPFFHVAALVVEILGGLCLLLGFKTRIAALILWLYLIPVTFTFHRFWESPPDMRPFQTLFFQHNWALIGGLLFVLACGAGAWSIDRRMRNAL